MSIKTMSVLFPILFVIVGVLIAPLVYPSIDVLLRWLKSRKN